MWRDDASLVDMLIWARRAAEYTDGLLEQTFLCDRVAQDATIRCIQLIGETAARVSDETRASHPEIEWAAIIGMRNRLVHEYARVNLDTVWRTATEGCVALIKRLERIVSSDAGSIPEEWEFL